MREKNEEKNKRNTNERTRNECQITKFAKQSIMTRSIINHDRQLSTERELRNGHHLAQVVYNEKKN